LPTLIQSPLKYRSPFKFTGRLEKVVVDVSGELARAYLSLADPAGAGSAVAEAERILHRRLALGLLGARLAALR